MSGCLFSLAVVCFVIGIIQLFIPDNPAQKPARQLAPARFSSPDSTLPNYAGVETISTSGGTGMLDQPGKLDWVETGQRIMVGHPLRGELMAHVVGQIVYAELWQQTRGPQSPWVPTGNAYSGFWLEGGLFLLNWQNRFYLLDESVSLSDAEIQRDFAPHARKFAQSDQTADVYFAYPPAMWHIDDIGKFRVASVQGEGLRFRPGAVGRFIHASGDSGRALVVEDYEGGGGGEDTAWIGYLVAEDRIQSA